MKTRTTYKAMKEDYGTIVKIPYCAMQNLLDYLEPTEYIKTSTYGWRADVYEVDPVNHIAICTGYAPMGNIEPKRDVMERYEKEAREIANGWDTWEVKREKWMALLKRFISEVTA